MKKFSLALVAALCLPVIAMTTGCGGSGENTVVAPPAANEEMTTAEQDAFDKGMEADMAAEGN